MRNTKQDHAFNSPKSKAELKSDFSGLDERDEYKLTYNDENRDEGSGCIEEEQDGHHDKIEMVAHIRINRYDDDSKDAKDAKDEMLALMGNIGNVSDSDGLEIQDDNAATVHQDISEMNRINIEKLQPTVSFPL